jgi:hypothetical protein
MTNLLLDIWTDLKEKRLWPVAALLLAALVAVPFVLAKPAVEAPAPAPNALSAPAGTPGAEVLPAELEAAKPLLATSTLSEFQSKNPFTQLHVLRKIERKAGVETGSVDDSAPAETDSGSFEGGGTGPTGGATPTPAPVEEEKRVYTYQAVVELATASGARRRVVNRLGILPNERNPLLVFLGVSAADNGEAVFLVDSTLTQAGEGRCRPSASLCSLLYLTAEEVRNEHIFTDDDNREYTIKLLGIRRVQVKAAQSSEPAPADPKPVAQVGVETVVEGDEAVVEGDEAVLEAAEPESPFAGFGFPFFADEEE